MRCFYHPTRNAALRCPGCKRPICDQCATSGKDEVFTCSRCVALKAAREAAHEMDERIEEKESKVHAREVRKKIRARIGAVFQWGILLAGIFVIVVQTPRLISAFKDHKPIRFGTYHTDAQTDRCIKNLWLIARRLQEGKMPGKDIVCPASRRPYVVATIDGDVVVRTPSPGLYGFKEIRVSRRKPVPELIR